MIKPADQKTKDTVNGFTRGLQSLLPNDHNNYNNIPSLVFMIITLFYYNPEYFTIHGDHMILNDDKSIIKMLYYGSGSINLVYGNIVINKSSTQKRIWTFNIMKPNVDATMVISIDSSNKKFANGESIGSKANNATSYYGNQSHNDVSIALRDDDSIRVYNSTVDENEYPYYYGEVYSDYIGEVKMDLNMNLKTLKYYVNERDQGIAFKDICFKNDEQYSMCITLDDEMTVKLSDYQHI